MNEMSRLAADQDDFRARFTIDEFERMCASGAFDDWKIELIDGELERMQSPMSMHGMRQARVVALLSQVAGLGNVVGAVGVDLGDSTLVECDAAVLRHPVAENRRLTAGDMLLVIEIAETTLKRDLGMKRRKYAGAGVPSYWVVDGVAGIVHVFEEPAGEAYASEAAVRFGELLAVPGTDAAIVLD